MIGFAQILGGAPAKAANMTKHLMAVTLQPEQARMAAYYQRGLADDPEMAGIALAVAAGGVKHSEGLDLLMQRYIQEGGDLDKLDQAEERISARLADAAHRIAEDKPPSDAPLAVIRPDISPHVAAGLGISGASEQLTEDQVNALLAGRQANGDKIAGKHYATVRERQADPKTGERRLSQPIGSYDFCPSPHKSVSVAWAFARPAEQAAIYQAHLQAARDAVAYLASETGRVRTGKGGQGESEQGQVAWVEFTHYTARKTAFSLDGDGNAVLTDKGAEIAGDPDLHTHFLIPNAVFAPSGRVGSLDTARIPGFIFEADGYYQARLATHLRAANFDVALDAATGAARMPAVPEVACVHFSKRTQLGEVMARQATTQRGEVWEELTQAQRERRMKIATQDHQQKQRGGKDDVADIQEWRRQAKEILNWIPPQSFELVGPRALPLDDHDRIHAAYRVSLPMLDAGFSQNAVLSNYQVRTQAARGLVATGCDGVADISRVTKLMREEGVTVHGDITALRWGYEPGVRTTRVTTVLHEEQEGRFIALAREAAADHTGDINLRGVDLRDYTAEQQAAIRSIASGGKFSIAVGSAGSGKTAMLTPLVASLVGEETSRTVYGASLAWRQADDLVSAGIPRANLRAFSVLLDSIRAGTISPGPRDTVVVDELALLGTRQALELLELRAKHGFSVIALGDDKQCASIEAGDIIDLSRRALGSDQVPEVLTSLRQLTQREREISGLLREGRAAEALTMKREDGTAILAYGGYRGTIDKVAELYRQRLTATGEAPAIAAPTNSDAHAIGEAVRNVRRDMGLLGDTVWTGPATDGTREYTLRLAVGDRVRLFENQGADYGAGTKQGGAIGRNGSVLEVVAADATHLTLRAGTGKTGRVAWKDMPRSASGRVQLAYGYAMTVHTAQGSTAREHIIALPAGSRAINGRLGYSAGTRHRVANYIVTSEQHERAAVQMSRPLNDPRPISQDDKWANVGRALAWQPEKDTATALRDRALSLKTGAMRVLQAVSRDHIAQRETAPAILTRMRLEATLVAARVMEPVIAFMQQARETARHSLGR